MQDVAVLSVCVWGGGPFTNRLPRILHGSTGGWCRASRLGIFLLSIRETHLCGDADCLRMGCAGVIEEIRRYSGLGAACYSGS